MSEFNGNEFAGVISSFSSYEQLLFWSVNDTRHKGSGPWVITTEAALKRIDKLVLTGVSVEKAFEHIKAFLLQLQF